MALRLLPILARQAPLLLRPCVSAVCPRTVSYSPFTSLYGPARFISKTKSKKKAEKRAAKKLQNAALQKQAEEGTDEAPAKSVDDEEEDTAAPSKDKPDSEVDAKPEDEAPTDPAPKKKGRSKKAATTSSSSPPPASSPSSSPSSSAAKGKIDKKSTAAALEETIRQIDQSFGKGSLMKLSAVSGGTTIDPSSVISTGSLALDVALGTGGLPLGRITEIYGPESSGKTTLALHVIAEAQKLGKRCVFIDSEHALNSKWAQDLGVDLETLLLSQPDSGEQALEIADSLIKAGKTDVIVIDSVAALVPRVELEGEMGDSHIGVQARLMSQALRKISPSIAKSNCVLIFINQIRMKIGVMFGSPETTPGGNALKFYSSIRLDIRRIGSVKRGDEICGSAVRVKVLKNKLAPPFREALFDIDYSKGISKYGEVIELGVKAGIVEKQGNWYSYKGNQLAVGREKTKQYLEQHPEMAAEIEQTIRDRLLYGKHLLDAAEAAGEGKDEEAGGEGKDAAPDDESETETAVVEDKQ